jgi:hypothetical protein
MDQLVIVEQAMTEVLHPMMRRELLLNLRALSDPDYQQRIWIEHGTEGTIQYDEFDAAVHFLYDDTSPSLAENPQAQVGYILKSEAEAEKIAALVKTIDAIFDKYGLDLTDAEYIAVPEWQSVVAAARDARSVIHD